VFRIYESGPTLLSRHHALPRTSLTNSAESTGLRLKLSIPLPYSSLQEEEGEEKEVVLSEKERQGKRKDRESSLRSVYNFLAMHKEHNFILESTTISML
jgi:hypothetical protein